MNKNKAFTLIELITVITIILIIAAIIFPVFSQAKISALSTKSISNLSQLGKSWQMYTDDNDQRLMPFAEYSNYSYFWWASYNGNLNYNDGLLSPYNKNAEINNDPLFTNHVMDVVGYKGFGYNYFYLSPNLANGDYQGIIYSDIYAPSSTANFVTSAFNYDGQDIGYPYVVPELYNTPSFQGRANSKGIVEWCDLHTSKRNVINPDNNHLGFLDTNYLKNSQ